MSIRAILESELSNADEETIVYLDSMICDAENIDSNFLVDNLSPFLESYGVSNGSEHSEVLCCKIFDRLKPYCKFRTVDDASSGPQLLDKAVMLSQIGKTQLSASEQATIDNLWGFANVRKMRNEVMETSEAGSARYERKAMKEQKKWLEQLEQKLDEDNNQVSAMTLPDFSDGSREKDIHVHNFDIMYGGQLLLQEAELKLVFGKRYGLIGRNGIGKTTLLKHMASFDIPGFPRHHRVLHVRQEVRSSTQSVLETVLEADVERTMLLQKEKDLLEQQQNLTDNSDTEVMQRLMNEMTDVHERMKIINVHNAESRAATILSGLRFSDAMQQSSVESLSGGWRMRVALASALFIEPDLLMLDEPTNHLDLEAVLWLEQYLRSYPNTVLLVSHDRAFLNEVCTDIILFQNQKLNYYRGNYDMFEGTRKEMLIVQQKQHEAQKIKLQHMQDFVDKFRYNAKRASLVQSRIKAIEKESVVDAVEEEETFEFEFFDAGQLGRPIIQIEGVTFGYRKDMEPLFRNVHLGIDQNSRIALVGPNGSGKSTLLKLIQKAIDPIDGFIRINPQLRLGIFTQHHIDSFDLVKSPIENMQSRWPLSTEPEIRAHLGRYEITGNDGVKPMKFLSGGQKSRVAFACLTFAKPHLVILDEPTNHLDMGAIEALANALKKFTGGVMLISHDQYFIQKVCNEIWEIKDHKITPFGGDFPEYKKIVIKALMKRG